VTDTHLPTDTSHVPPGGVHSRGTCDRAPNDFVGLLFGPRVQWRSNGVGRVGKVQGGPSEGAPEFQFQGLSYKEEER